MNIDNVDVDEKLALSSFCSVFKSACFIKLRHFTMAVVRARRRVMSRLSLHSLPVELLLEICELAELPPTSNPWSEYGSHSRPGSQSPVFDRTPSRRRRRLSPSSSPEISPGYIAETTTYAAGNETSYRAAEIGELAQVEAHDQLSSHSVTNPHSATLISLIGVCRELRRMLFPFRLASIMLDSRKVREILASATKTAFGGSVR